MSVNHFPARAKETCEDGAVRQDAGNVRTGKPCTQGGKGDGYRHAGRAETHHAHSRAGRGHDHQLGHERSGRQELVQGIAFDDCQSNHVEEVVSERRGAR